MFPWLRLATAAIIIMGVTQPHLALAQGTLLRSTPSSIKNAGPPSDKVRVEYATIRVRDGKAILRFEAASLDKTCDLSGNKSAWLQIQLKDANGELTPFVNATVAEVQERGGYQAHIKDVSNVFQDPELFSFASGFNMRMIGGVAC